MKYQHPQMMFLFPETKLPCELMIALDPPPTTAFLLPTTKLPTVLARTLPLPATLLRLELTAVLHTPTTLLACELLSRLPVPRTLLQLELRSLLSQPKTELTLDPARRLLHPPTELVLLLMREFLSPTTVLRLALARVFALPRAVLQLALIRVLSQPKTPLLVEQQSPLPLPQRTLLPRQDGLITEEETRARRQSERKIFMDYKFQLQFFHLKPIRFEFYYFLLSKTHLNHPHISNYFPQKQVQSVWEADTRSVSDHLMFEIHAKLIMFTCLNITEMGIFQATALYRSLFYEGACIIKLADIPVKQ